MKPGLAVSALVAAALLFSPPASDLGAASSIADPGSTAAVNSEAQARLDQGDEFFAMGKYGAARSEYEAAAELIRADGQLPTKALRRVANSHYYEGRYQSAGIALEKLAKEAAEWGDVVTQAWAIADAAWVAGKAGDKLDVDRRVERLQRLLSSDYIPNEVKEEIRAKRLGDYAVALGS